MATHLVTFLGRAATDGNGDPNAEPVRTYRFPDGSTSAPVRLFARAALAHLDAGDWRPDRIVVLGTSGSMWEALLSELADGIHAPELQRELRDAARAHAAAPSAVQRVATEVWARLDRAVACHVVPAGATDAEQWGVLAAMADGVARGDRLVLDLTHRYRHLPLAGLVAASLLAYDRGVELLDVWYADLQVGGDAEPCPVLSLRPLLAVQDWGRALAVLRESGRTAAVATALGDHPAAGPLRDTGFFLATNQIAEARRAGQRALAALRADGAADPLLAIVRDDVAASLDWVDEPRVWDRMLDVARRALAAGDYLEAVTMTQEALYWAAAGTLWDTVKPDESHALEALKRQLLGTLKGRRHDVDRFHRLRKLRNTVAHGLKPSGRGADTVRRILADAATYTEELGALIDWVDRLAGQWASRPKTSRDRR